MMTINKIIVRVIFSFFIGSFLISCESTASSQVKATSKYDKLCQIYKEVVSRPVELREKEVALLRRVQNELPDFFTKNFTHIFNADADRRYPLIKGIAEQEIKSEWTCEVMKSYYDNEFDMSENKRLSE